MDKINDAIELLNKVGYIVIKKTLSMDRAMDECEANEDKECLGCACNKCLMQ